MLLSEHARRSDQLPAHGVSPRAAWGNPRWFIGFPGGLAGLHDPLVVATADDENRTFPASLMMSMENPSMSRVWWEKASVLGGAR